VPADASPGRGSIESELVQDLPGWIEPEAQLAVETDLLQPQQRLMIPPPVPVGGEARPADRADLMMAMPRAGGHAARQADCWTMRQSS
jgi:hypothetical protein